MQSSRESEDSREDNYRRYTKKQMFGTVLAAGFIGAGLFITTRYRVAKANQWLVFTGIGRKNGIEAHKWGIQWPGQIVKPISMEPISLKIDIDAASKSRIDIKIPIVTIAGVEDHADSVIKFAKTLSDKTPAQMNDLLDDALKGDVRILTAKQEIDDLYADREGLKTNVTDKVGPNLEQYGLKIRSLNIAELKDKDKDKPYLEEQSRRAYAVVHSKAQIDTAEAKQKGEIGEKENEIIARQRKADLEKVAKKSENESAVEIASSNKDREIKEAGFNRDIAIAEAQGKASAEKTTCELQQKVEEARSEQKLAELRASKKADAQVSAEVQVVNAEGGAAAAKAEAQGRADALIIQANAKLYQDLKTAEGTLAIKEAEAKGFDAQIKAFGSAHAFIQFMLIKEGTLPELERARAEGFHGLNPKITVVNTGTQPDGAAKTVTDFFKATLPIVQPLLESFQFKMPDNTANPDNEPRVGLRH